MLAIDDFKCIRNSHFSMHIISCFTEILEGECSISIFWSKFLLQCIAMLQLSNY